MTSDNGAVFAAPRIASMFDALARDCTVAIERPAVGVSLWAAFRTVRGGTLDATNVMLFDDLVVGDALKGAGGGRHVDD